MFRIIILLMSLLPLLSSCVTSSKVASKNVNAQITAFGIYETVGKTKIVDSPGTTAGKSRNIGDINFLQETTDIPAKIGTRFGFTYKTSGMLRARKVQIKKVFTHPEFKGKTGFTKKSIYPTDDYSSFEAKIGYGFDEEFELVPGKWTLEIWYKDKLLVGKSFTVLAPQ